MVMTYYTSKDTKFTISNPFNPKWVSMCHNQPQMDNIPMYLDVDTEEVFGVCRRCGNQATLTDTGFYGSLFWDGNWGVENDETTSPM